MIKPVFLDYGHGGSDPGACSGGLMEKSMNLFTGEACRAELQRHGITVYTSRTSDITVSLNERTNLANRTDAGYFVSIHHNSGKGDRGEYIHSIVAGEGKRLAEAIGDELYAVLGQQKKVYSKQGSFNNDYYHVIRNTKMTAVIVEVCFIDNKVDVQIADTVEEQQRNGIIIAHGILKFLGVAIKTQGQSSIPAKPTIPTVPGGTIYRVVMGSYKERANANAMVDKLKGEGYKAFLDAFKKDGVDYLRVICGSYKDRVNADKVLNELKAKGYNPFIAVYNGSVDVSTSTPAPKPQSVDLNTEIKRYSESGKCTITAKSGIKFRDKPSTSTGAVQGTYSYNESVNYDLVVVTEGYTWISWISASSGARRYMPIVDRKSNERWGTCI